MKQRADARVTKFLRPNFVQMIQREFNTHGSVLQQD
jgi:hypothetical protein